MYKYAVFLAVLLCSYSCRHEINKLSETHNENYVVKKFQISDFPETKLLRGQKKSLPQLTNPKKIVVVEDYIVVFDNAGDTIFNIFDKKFNHLGKIGKWGVGPNELDGASIMGKGFNKNEFWANSINSKQLGFYNAENIENIYSAKDIRQRTDEMFLAVYLTPINGGNIISRRADGDDKFVEFNDKGKVVKTYHKWSDMLSQKDIPSNVISSLFQGKIISDEESKYVALACIQTDIIELLDRNTGAILSIRGPLHNVPKFSVDYSSGYPMCLVDIETAIYAYFDVSFAKDKIYALYSGHDERTLVYEKQPVHCEQIFVFDLQGNPLTYYTLDFSIERFDIDYENNRIIGITYDENPNLVVFDM